VYFIELLDGEVQSCSPNAFTHPPTRKTQEGFDFMYSLLGRNQLFV
jgi:hypothetical protein